MDRCWLNASFFSSFRNKPYSLHSRRGELSCAVLLEQSVKSFLLSNLESARLDARMVHAKQRVDVVHGLCAHIGELLDLSRGVLDLFVGECETKLFDARLDGVPTGQTMPDGHVAGEAKVLWLEDLVGRGVIKDRLGVDPSLVRECDITTVRKIVQRP